MAPGFRRRILIEPAPGRVVAELEDDWHRMVVALVHRDGVVTSVQSEMKRRPWTTCPGAMAELEATFLGQRLADVHRRGEKTRNCTHLYDLALFAAGHAGEAASVAYEIFVADPVDGVVEAGLRRDGARVLDWVMAGGRFTAPPELEGRTLGQLGDWIATQDDTGAEAARILRWATMMGSGRALDIPTGLSATAFPPGACYTFQPETAKVGVRVPDAQIDFSREDRAPMSDRASAFPEPVR